MVLNVTHTPGPWTLETVKTSVGHCHKIGPFPSFDETRKTYACVYVDGYGLRRGAVWDELLANAHLIAAAPAMKAAIEQAITTHGGPIDGNDTVDGKEYVMVEMGAFRALEASIVNVVRPIKCVEEICPSCGAVMVHDGRPEEYCPACRAQLQLTKTKPT